MEGRPAHPRLRRRDHRLHPGRGASPAGLRPPQADDRGATIVALACALLIPTNILVGPYTVLAVIAYTLFGLGLAFYATPSTDAALSNLPPAQAGAGAGIYKMASSLGGAIGAALSLTIFTSFLGDGVTIVGDLLHTQGIQENAAVRQAGMVTFMFNVVLALVAIISITVTVPKGKKYYD